MNSSDEHSIMFLEGGLFKLDTPLATGIATSLRGRVMGRRGMYPPLYFRHWIQYTSFGMSWIIQKKINLFICLLNQILEFEFDA